MRPVATKCWPWKRSSKKPAVTSTPHRGERVTLEELASAVGASPFHLQRRFKEAFGVSPRDYQDAQRVEAVKSSLKNGSRVTDAVFEAGYGSVSRFYEKPHLGMTARDYRASGKGQRIAYCSFASPLGTVLIAATEQGPVLGEARRRRRPPARPAGRGVQRGRAGAKASCTS